MPVQDLNPSSPEDPVEARALRRLVLLEELAEIGVEIARALRPGVAPEEPTARRDPAAAFAQVSRAIRLTLNLEAKTEAELNDWRAGGDRRSKAQQARVEALGEARKEQARRSVVSVITDESRDDVEFDNLWEALEERLEQDEGYDECGHRPLRETVERLCADLGLTPDWEQWGEDGWIYDGPPARPRWSLFNQTSRKPLNLWAPPSDCPRPPHLE